MFEKLKNLLQESLLLGGLVFLIAYPNLYYFSIHVFYPQLVQRVGAENIRTFLLIQSVNLVFLLCLSAFCGLAFSIRNGLAGLGHWRDLKAWKLGWVAPLIIGIWLVSYFAFDQEFMKRAPELYPREWYWALTIPLRAAFLEELVFHFGMLTVTVGGLKRLCPAWLANGLVAVFYSFVATGKTFQTLGLLATSDRVTLMAFAGAFLTSYVLGAIYMKRGLASAIFFHFLIAFKFVWIALL